MKIKMEGYGNGGTRSRTTLFYFLLSFSFFEFLNSISSRILFKVRANSIRFGLRFIAQVFRLVVSQLPRFNFNFRLCRHVKFQVDFSIEYLCFDQSLLLYLYS